MDKKGNMAYWDAIDDVMVDAVKGVAALSTSDKRMDDDNEIDDDILGIAKEALDIVIERLTEVGYEFPYVDENY